MRYFSTPLKKTGAAHTRMMTRIEQDRSAGGYWEAAAEGESTTFSVLTLLSPKPGSYKSYESTASFNRRFYYITLITAAQTGIGSSHWCAALVAAEGGVRDTCTGS
ncbi:hypothetical protein E2C01_100234 [Portunus trituberculatus]|uniref:Uncharacterized protein n=1 Tax=Portunus trituberculatus TaxID=210409 RepID=A0A5B7KBH0_PORTR|nr:hypothetical protein [Portunus trituberculatus]